ncbi:MAG: hypothetical protein LBQ64_05160, partial [Bacteroidales bacterium]|nr:hypothetical protein [Bacteroidales bacterium]
MLYGFFCVPLQLRIYVISSNILNHKEISKHPEWALAQKRKGTELRCINGRYYLYEVSSKWNPEKKKSVKITGKLLGSITEKNGFVESEKAILKRQQVKIDKIKVKEYGVSA